MNAVIEFIKNRYFKWLLVILCMLGIFGMSHLDSVKSWYMTGKVMTTVTQTQEVVDEMEYEEEIHYYSSEENDFTMHLLRKIAHVIEFFKPKGTDPFGCYLWLYGVPDNLHDIPTERFYYNTEYYPTTELIQTSQWDVGVPIIVSFEIPRTIGNYNLVTGVYNSLQRENKFTDIETDLHFVSVGWVKAGNDH